MTESFQFLRPAWLLLIPAAALIIWRIARRGDPERSWRGIIDPQLLEALITRVVRQSRIRPLTLLGVVSMISIIALAGPAWRQEPSPFSEDKAALIIVLKVTPSMMTQDLPPSRLERAVHKIKDLLERRAGARTSLIAYAGSAHLVMPLTRDADIINTYAGDLRPEIMPREGDDPAAALALAEERLKKSGLAGSILFITDGIAASEAENMVKQSETGAAGLVILGAAGLDRESPERNELTLAAKTLNADLVFVSPDDRDVDALAGLVERSLASATEAEGGARMCDEGYWLMFLICLLALMWFRQGWVVQHE